MSSTTRNPDSINGEIILWTPDSGLRTSKWGCAVIAQPHFSCQCLLEGRPCERRFPQSRVTHFEQARLWRLVWFLRQPAGRNCPGHSFGAILSTCHTPHITRLTSHWLPPRTVLLSFDLPTHDPFQMDQIPVDHWVGHCSYLWIASAEERVNFVNASTNYSIMRTIASCGAAISAARQDDRIAAGKTAIAASAALLL